MSKKVVSKIAPVRKDPQAVRHDCAILLQNIPESIKCDFKAACARRNTTMRDAFLLFMCKFARETP